MNSPTPSRLPQLDVLRFIAIFLVIGAHNVICPPEISPTLNTITAFWYRGGWSGVDLFFVLSGFLVSGLLFREYQKTENLNIGKFLIRRGFKIYPSFWLLIIVTTIVTYLTKGGINKAGTLGEMLFVQNYFSNLWWHTWSLAIEEHFYFGLSILFCTLLWLHTKNDKNPFSKIPKIFIFLAFACLAARVLTAHYLPWTYERNVTATHLRLDSLFFGVFLSYCWHFGSLSENAYLKRHKSWIAAFGALLFLPAFIFELNAQDLWISVIGFSMFYLGAGLLLISFLKMDFSNSRFLNILGRIGIYSYSIYLWNMPIHYWGDKAIEYYYGEFNWWIYIIIYFPATFLIGIGTAKLVEYPVLKIRDRYFPSNNQPITPYR